MYLSKEMIIGLFQRKPFPKEAIAPECLSHFDILFSNESLLTIHTEKPDYHNNFVFDTQKLKHKESIESANNWRNPKINQSIGVDNFFQKGKPNKLNTPETTISPSNKDDKSFEQYEQRKSSLNEEIYTTPKASMNEERLLFSGLGKDSFQSSRSFIYTNKNTPTNQSECLFDIKVVYNTNKKLHVSYNDPLWYVYNSFLKYSFGPFSSMQLEGMYISKQVLSCTLIRPIDIFKIKNKEPFSYIQLKDLENSNLIEPPKIQRNLNLNIQVCKEIDLNYLLELKQQPILKFDTGYKQELIDKENKKSITKIEEELNNPKTITKICKKKKKQKNFEQDLNKGSIYDSSSLYKDIYKDFSQYNEASQCNKNVANKHSLNENYRPIETNGYDHQDISYRNNYEMQYDISHQSKIYPKKTKSKGYQYRNDYINK